MDTTTSSDLEELRSWVERTLGLSFPEQRSADLLRGVCDAQRELGLSSMQALRESLDDNGKTLEVLARHLTIGETYFFRERGAFDGLEEKILPALVGARKDTSRFLRIWSAGCATGEEPYSIAITLARALPDFRSWNARLLATDINSAALEAAAVARYRLWSFRETSEHFRYTYFTRRLDDLFELRPAIRRMVEFSRLNLAGEFPPPFSTPGSFDVIFCRNVLLYFTPSAAKAVLSRIERLLATDGWLVGGVADHLNPPASLVPVPFPGAALFQKRDPSSPAPAPAVTTPTVQSRPPRLEKLPPRSLAPPLGARQLANAGRVEEALALCEAEIARDRLNPAHHYLHALISLESDDCVEAEKSLRRALFLDPEFVLGHYALATIAQQQGQIELSRRHLANATRLLSRYDSDDVLPESDGLSAGRLLQIIETSLATSE